MNQPWCVGFENMRKPAAHANIALHGGLGIAQRNAGRRSARVIGTRETALFGGWWLEDEPLHQSKTDS